MTPGRHEQTRKHTINVNRSLSAGFHLWLILFISIPGFGQTGEQATLENLAPLAEVTGPGKKVRATVDGVKQQQDGSGEWIGDSPNAWYGWISYPSIELTWKTPQKINTVVLHDRTTLDEHMAAGDEVKVKIGVSYTSLENARRNLEAECAHWDFTRVRNASRRIWNHWLGNIEVKGGEEETRVKFYTDLWHTLLGRHKIDDVSGDYPSYMGPANKQGIVPLVVRRVPVDEAGRPRHHMFIQKAELNGKPLESCGFYHPDFANGGILELWLGPVPNKQWGQIYL